MIAFSQEKEIDLSDYGMEGKIVLRTPTLRRTIKMNNEMGKYTKIDKDNPANSTVELGMVGILTALSYVVEAPFQPNINSFLAYCDRMDDNCLGSADLLYRRLNKEVKLMKEAEEANSPLDSSPVPETGTSD